MGLIRLKVILLHQRYSYGSLAAGICTENVPQCPNHFHMPTNRTHACDGWKYNTQTDLQYTLVHLKAYLLLLSTPISF